MVSEKYVFGAFITNLEKYTEGILVGEWVGFPTTYEHLKSVMDKIGISPSNVEYVTDYDSKIKGLFKLTGEYVNLDELNYLASQLKELNESDLERYEAALDHGYYDSIQDLINLADNLGNYRYYSGITDEQELGEYLIKECQAMDVGEDILPYFDFEAYGRDVSINEGGIFTSNGYISNSDGNFTEYYDGKKENIPSEYCVTSKPQEVAEQNKSQDKTNENINRNRALAGMSR